ncbi:MAG: transporter [Caulobacteraceae bacterium]|nr:transporter [Caulobacteraceae bacterium]
MSGAPALLAAAAGRERFDTTSWLVAGLCAAVAFLDGFDTQSLAPAAKSIADSLGVTMSAFGPIFSASQIGFLVGAFAFGSLGDRFGRKRLLGLAALVFGLSTLATAFADSYGALFLARILAGVGLGGATPNFVALASEFSPQRLRARVVTCLWAAVPLGGMAGAFASALILPRFGWQAIFLLGGATPVAIAAVLFAALPESAEAGAQATRGAASGRLADLFSEGRAASTAWLWLASFMTWTVLIVMSFWTPPLLQRSGWSAPSAAQILALNNAGGVVGTLLLGAALTRLRPQAALAGALVGAAIFLAAMGAAVANPALVAVAALLAGFCASAAGGAMLAVSAAAYPPAARSTGVGWALGVGRIGAVIGPSAAGLLVARAWPVNAIYLAIAAPAVLAAIFVLLLSRTAAFARLQPSA